MRIGIDARFYGTLGKGLGRYTAELIRGLEALPSEYQFVVYLRPENAGEYVPTKSNFQKVIVDLPWYGLREQLWWPWFLSSQELDLVHFPHFNVPILCPVPFVVTIHDLILLRHPTVEATTHTPIFYWAKHYAYRLVLAVALRRARAIITVSRFVADDLRRRFGFLTKPITVTHEAAYQSAGIYTPRDTKKSGYMTLGNAYPHKNLEWLSDFFTPRSETLTLVGKIDTFRARLQERFSKQTNLKFPGELTDAEVGEALRSARALILPSLYEGFGLPVLETQVLGTPVLAHFDTALPEVGGMGVVYFQAAIPMSLSRSMALLDRPEFVAWLTVRGEANAGQYSWGNLARTTYEVYGQIEKSASR